MNKETTLEYLTRSMIVGIFAALLLLCFFSCSKKEETTPTKTDCKTCTEHVIRNGNASGFSEYDASVIEYCNGEWKQYDGKYDYKKVTNGGTWYSEEKKTTCK